MFNGKKLKKKQREAIKARAIANKYIPNVPVRLLTESGLPILTALGLSEKQWNSGKFWKLKDRMQFKYLNEQLGGAVPGYTWHHTEVPGRMQLVPFESITSRTIVAVDRQKMWGYIGRRRS